jgi:hypothetical protein
MSVPDETNNFATHGKAPIPSNANGSFVVPHDREANPRHERPKLDRPANLASQVAASLAAESSLLGISMPSPTATMASPQTAPVAMTTVPQQIIPQSPEMLQQQMAQQQFMQQQMAQQQQMQMQQMPMQQQVMSQQQMMPQQPIQQPMVAQQVVPQQMPQQQQIQMQQMPMQQQVMPQQQMMPQQPIQQQVVQLPMGAQQISPNQIVMTPAQIAEMQAQIMAKALLTSQNQIFHRQKQTYKRSEEEPMPEYTAEDEPEQKDIRDQAPSAHETISSETHGERVIQPIHDVTMEQQREDMSRRMTELLGDTGDAGPVAVNTKTAKQIKQGKLQMPDTRESEMMALTPEQIQERETARAAQIRASQPTPAELFPEYSPLTGERIEPPHSSGFNTAQRRMEAAQQARSDMTQIYTNDVNSSRPPKNTSDQEAFVEQAYSYRATPQTSRDITSRMDAPQMQAQEPSQMQSMDPRLAAIQQQQLMLLERQKMLQKEEAEQAEEARRLAEEAEQIERQQEEARQKAAAQQQATPPTNSPKELNPNRKSIRVNAEVVKKAALATILRRPTPPPEPEELKPVDPIRPAYVAELEEQLANDMKKSSDSELAAKMAAELADDEITKNAQQIQSEIPAATPEAVAEAMPEEVLKAIENVNPANPNIASSLDEQLSIDNTASLDSATTLSNTTTLDNTAAQNNTATLANAGQ